MSAKGIDSDRKLCFLLLTSVVYNDLPFQHRLDHTLTQPQQRLTCVNRGQAVMG